MLTQGPKFWRAKPADHVMKSEAVFNGRGADLPHSLFSLPPARAVPDGRGDGVWQLSWRCVQRVGRGVQCLQRVGVAVGVTFFPVFCRRFPLRFRSNGRFFPLFLLAAAAAVCSFPRMSAVGGRCAVCSSAFAKACGPSWCTFLYFFPVAVPAHRGRCVVSFCLLCHRSVPCGLPPVFLVPAKPVGAYFVLCAYSRQPLRSAFAPPHFFFPRQRLD